MLPRKHRFSGLGSVRPTLRHGHSVRGPGFALKLQVGNAHQPSRLAVIVSKKVSKRAVVRNRIRRRVFAALGESIVDTKAWDVVVIVYDVSLQEREFTDLQQQLRQALAKAQ